ncbi:non-homologous end-joining DNA ligase [Enterovirga sp. CN4-39]|uniref:non-homologous end-joining DNA ligase n=1 Tax=Enterovirga sp. CN4-39 TaxID=3400910 RepID=UPI003C0407DB
MAKEETEIDGVRLTSPDKVLYPEQGVTKRDLAEYYLAVADVMLPHVARRPITLVRCPTGREKKCFYQRHAGSGVPPELKQIPIEGFEEPYLYLEDSRGLIALVQMGVLEIHPWNSHVDKPHRPDQVVFDLDPGEGLAFPDVVAAAHELRAKLDSLGLASVPKTTGGKGLHLVVPIERRYEWRDVKSFAKAVGNALAKDAPDRYLTKQSIAERRGRIYIDYLRNDPTSTAVAPYSTRSREGAPVSVPLTWDEVVPSLDPKAFTVRTVPTRVASLKADPWASIAEMKQRLPKL